MRPRGGGGTQSLWLRRNRARSRSRRPSDSGSALKPARSAKKTVRRSLALIVVTRVGP